MTPPPTQPTPAPPPEPPRDARVVSVEAQRLARWLDGFTERHGGCTVDEQPERVTLTGTDGARAWLDVPFGPLDGSLVAHATRERRIGVLLVRRGGYAVGVFDGARLTMSKTGTAYVQGTTKAGGWSQQRYARRRANQSHAAFARAADAAVQVMGRVRLQALVAGGDRPAVSEVLADPRLREVPAPSGEWLQVKDPRRAVLLDTPRQFLAVRIALWP